MTDDHEPVAKVLAPSIGEIATKLGESYRLWKKTEAKKDDHRKAFFAAATEAVEGTLAEAVVDLRADDEDAAHALAAKYYPAHEVEDLRRKPNTYGTFEAVIVENPAFKPFSFVNTEDGHVYTRQVSQGSPMLDDERLAAEDPKLYAAVTYVPYYDALCNAIYEAGVDQREIEEWLEGHFDYYPPERLLRPLETLDPEILSKLQHYMFMSPPIVKLATPRVAKAEELQPPEPDEAEELAA